MSEKFYSRISSISIAAAIASVILFDRKPALAIYAIGLGVAALAAGITAYFVWQFHPREAVQVRTQETPVPVGHQADDGRDEIEWVNFNDVVAEYAGTIQNIGQAQRVLLQPYFQQFGHPQNEMFQTGGVFEAAQYYTVAWAQYHRPRSIVDDVLQIAKGLASDKFEVVLSVDGDITVRPCTATSGRDKRQEELPFSDQVTKPAEDELVN